MIRLFLPHRRRHLLRSAAGIVALAACVVTQGGCTAGIGTGSIAGTGKTPLDRAYSWASGKDCSMARQRNGDTYCVEDEVATPVTVHCYPTLGEVACYATSDPYRGRQRELGSAPSSLQATAAQQAGPAPAPNPVAAPAGPATAGRPPAVPPAG